MPDVFHAGEMSDAAEVLEAIYDSLAAVLGGAQLVDSVFGLRVSEAVHCGSCGRDTHHNTYTQFFHTVPATALRLQAMISGGDGALPPLGRLLGVRCFPMGFLTQNRTHTCANAHYLHVADALSSPRLGD